MQGGDYAAGIGDGDNSWDHSQITISGGIVTAEGKNSKSAGIGYGDDTIYEYPGGRGGTFSTGTNGHAVVNAVSESTGIRTNSENRDSWSGVIIENGQLSCSGTLAVDYEIPEDGKLVIPEEKTLTIASGITLTNNGVITNNGTIDGVGTLINNNKYYGSGIRSATYTDTSYGYINENDSDVTLTEIEYIRAASSDTEWKDCTVVVDRNVTVSSRIKITGTVKLILVDGCTLTAYKGINAPEGSTLNVYGQELNTGKLIAAGVEGNAGIGSNLTNEEASNMGSINIYGGIVDASAEGAAAAIGAGNGSTDTDGVLIKSSGVVKADGNNPLNPAPRVDSGIVLSNGELYASAELASNCEIPSGTIMTIPTGKTLTLTEIIVTLTNNGVINNEGTINGDGILNNKNRIVSYKGTIAESVIRTGNPVMDTFTYIDAEGNPQTIDNFRVAASTDTVWNNETVIVNDDITVNDRIIIKGNVNLVLGDGYTLNTVKGIEVDGEGVLKIYGQEKGTGHLTAAAEADTAALCCRNTKNWKEAEEKKGSIHIYGGIIDAVGGSDSAGIGSNRGFGFGNILIAGGTVNATGGSNAAGIGDGYSALSHGTITIIGGTVNAYGKGSNSAAIGNGQDGNSSFGQGSFSTSLNGKAGNAVIYTYSERSDNKAIRTDIQNRSEWSGWIIENGSLADDAVLSDNYSLTKDRNILIPVERTLTIPAGKTLTNYGTLEIDGTVVLNGELINHGKLIMKGDIQGNGTLKSYTKCNNLGTISPDIRLLGVKSSLDYVDEKGNDKSSERFQYVTKNDTEWTDGFYVASGDITLITRITINGNVTLILEDGCTLDAVKGIYVKEGSTFNVYGQAAGTGTLNATGTSTTGDAGIGGGNAQNSGTVNIYSGIINAKGGASYGAGIGGGSNGAAAGTINIAGGIVNAAGGDGGAGIGGGRFGAAGTINITGGIVNGAGGDWSAGIGDGGYAESHTSIMISGGEVTASGNFNGASGIGYGYNQDTPSGGSFSTGDNGTAVIYASTAADVEPIRTGTVSRDGGVIFEKKNTSVSLELTYDCTPTFDYSIPSDNSVKINSGKTLTIENNRTWTNWGTITVDGTISLSGSLVNYGTIIISEGGSVSGTGVITNYGELKGSGSTDVSVTNANSSVAYIDKNEAPQNTTDYLTVRSTKSNQALEWKDRTYVVSGEVTVNGRITVSGEVNLILADGCTFNADKGIAVNEGNTLNILRQERGSGQLNAGATLSTEADAGIGSNNNTAAGTINLYGGIINAQGGSGAAGIGCGKSGNNGTVLLAGGEISAKSNGGSQAVGAGNGTSAMPKVMIAGGILFRDGTGCVNSDSYSLTHDFTIPEGSTLVIEDGVTVTVEEGVTLTNNGTISIEKGGKLIVNGRVSGTGNLVNKGEITKRSYSLTAPVPVVTGTTVTLGRIDSDSAEYGCKKSDSDGINWQKVNVFNDLEPETSYIFYIRYQDDAYLTGGGISAPSDAVTTGFAAPDENVGYTINYRAETITVVAGYEINTRADFTGDMITSESDAYSITDMVDSTNTVYLYIRKTASGSITSGSATEIVIMSRSMPMLKADKQNETVTIPEGYKYGTAGADYDQITTSGTGTAISAQTGTNIYVYIPADDNHLRSRIQTIVPPEHRLTPGLTLDYVDETVDTSTDMMYKTGNEGWQDCTAVMNIYSDR